MKQIFEIYWLRFYGCLAVFLYHLLDRVNQYADNVYLDLTRLSTVLGTPTFIFISIFLFTIRYGKTIPAGFLSQRIKYLLIPYITYAIIYSGSEYFLAEGHPLDSGYGQLFVNYLIYCDWHGYFLLIAIQFYAFYWCYIRYDLGRYLNVTAGVMVGTLISMLYWGSATALDITLPGYLLWVIPIGWLYIFFFAIRVAHQYYYDRLNSGLGLRGQAALLAVSFMVMIGVVLMTDIELSSKEAWVMPLFLLFIGVTMRLFKGRGAPAFVRMINRHSFGIYLSHPIFFGIFEVISQKLDFGLIGYTLLLGIVGFLCSLGLSALANRHPLSGLIMGRQLRIGAAAGVSSQTAAHADRQYNLRVT
ncbi:acyltransferase family protein [Chromohalobacter nigrandesensis]|uniref:acyltransferase family protein n=1 Tax=Chromohalobacter nigrandesensis TaxID=119863 RepID=UPI001FF6B027|nr:acyltransferase family protein [Chromohalobacter nigrandesensis]MCK0744279.1 acyltransferase family protein [Chromohalobacter nigrandesensis]